MNYGLSLDWDGDPDNRPDYVRGDSFYPCDCKDCFFCMKGLTSGIAHAGAERPAMCHYKCGKRMRTDGCTDVRVPLNIGRYAFHLKLGYVFFVMLHTTTLVCDKKRHEMPQKAVSGIS